LPTDVPSSVDPRGRATFLLTGLALAASGFLILRGGLLPRGLGYTAFLSAALLVFVYIGRLVILDPKRRACSPRRSSPASSSTRSGSRGSASFSGGPGRAPARPQVAADAPWSEVQRPFSGSVQMRCRANSQIGSITSTPTYP